MSIGRVQTICATSRPASGREPVSGEYAVAIPTSALTLDGFRSWSSSAAFPDRGKIAFLGAEIFIDMGPERLRSHGLVRSEICRVVANLVVKRDPGEFYQDRTRIVRVEADLSSEPEGLFVSWAALAAGRIHPVPAADGEDFIEFAGSADCAPEVVSPASPARDTVQLRERYHRAGVKEYWLIAARGEAIHFDILIRYADGNRPAPRNGDWQKSKVFGKLFRLRRITNGLGGPAFRLDVK